MPQIVSGKSISILCILGDLENLTADFYDSK